jgi:exopolyphosphatase/pppGpp-phosphohydrolase
MARAVADTSLQVGSEHAGDVRLAAIDIGSNSLHMIVAQVDADGAATILWRMKEMVGLGRNSFPSHRLTKRESMCASSAPARRRG